MHTQLDEDALQKELNNATLTHLNLNIVIKIIKRTIPCVKIATVRYCGYFNARISKYVLEVYQIVR